MYIGSNKIRKRGNTLLNRLKNLRETSNLSLEELSNKVGIPKTSLSNYERGNREPKIEVWNKLADFFNVPVAYLMGISNSKTEIEFFEIREQELSKDMKSALDEINGFVSELIKEGNGWHALQAKKIIENLNEIFWYDRFLSEDYSVITAITDYSNLVSGIKNGSIAENDSGKRISDKELFEKYLSKREEVLKSLDNQFLKEIL